MREFPLQSAQCPANLSVFATTDGIAVNDVRWLQILEAR
jgi:hypothetical protein